MNASGTRQIWAKKFLPPLVEVWRAMWLQPFTLPLYPNENWGTLPVGFSAETVGLD